MKKLIADFNNKSTYLVVSDYPEVTELGEKNYGIAWHTKEIVEAMAEKYGLKFVVLAEKGMDSAPRLYQKDQILVLRVFDQKHPSLFPSILKWLQIFNRIKEVHVHSEFFVNGGFKNYFLLPLFLALIRISGKKITYYTHNVVGNLNSIAPHLNLKSNSFLLHILNISARYYYKIISLFTHRFVVMDEAIKARLKRYINVNKIITIPFWVNKKTYPLSSESAKTQLGLKKNDLLLLYFGFITYYKGADWIINAFNYLKPKNKYQKIHLILAGGPAYSLKEKDYYIRYYHSLLKNIKNKKSIRITGFIPEEKIGLYFKAADVVILPYRGLIGASSTLTYALAYNKPFVISHKMHKLLNNEEVKTVLCKNKVTANHLMFNLDNQSFKQLVNRVVIRNERELLQKISRGIAKTRSKQLLVPRCYEQLFKTSPQPALKYSPGIRIYRKSHV